MNSIAYEIRVRELSRMSKTKLAEILRSHRDIVWSAVPVQKWSQDELINDILRAEFPNGGEVATCEHGHTMPHVDDSFLTGEHISCPGPAVG